MDSYDFHRRQRVRREQERLHARQVKTSAGTYRMSIRAMNVAPFLRRRDAERVRQRKTRQSRAAAAKVDLNASFFNSTQLNASPRREAHHKNLLNRVTSFRNTSPSRVTSFRKSSASHAKISMDSSNPMFDRSNSERSADEYVVHTPFVLPVRPTRSRLSSFKPGKYFSPGMNSIIKAALAEKRAAEKKLNKKASDATMSQSEQQDKNGETVVEADVEPEAASETIEEDVDVDKTPTLASTSRAPSFFRGLFGAKPSSSQSTRSSVPTALAWPAWMTKAFATKSNTKPEASSEETSEQAPSTTGSEANAIGTWFNNLLKPSSDESSAPAEPAAAAEENEETEEVIEKPRQSTRGLGRWFRGVVGTSKAAIVTPGARTSGRSWMPKLGARSSTRAAETNNVDV